MVTGRCTVSAFFSIFVNSLNQQPEAEAHHVQSHRFCPLLPGQGENRSGMFGLGVDSIEAQFNDITGPAITKEIAGFENIVQLARSGSNVW